jgi:hypothetical protein
MDEAECPDFEKVECEYLNYFDEDHNYALWEMFAAPCCFYLNVNICTFLRICELHIFAITVSDFRVRSVFLPVDDLLRMEQLAIGPRAHFTNHFDSRSANMAHVICIPAPVSEKNVLTHRRRY